VEKILLEQIKLDVSDLLPPEPMTQILLALSKLTPAQYLTVLHRRQPFPLYEKLLSTGWQYHCIDCSNSDESFFKIHITQDANYAELMAIVNKESTQQ
jgi:uncharacterized protein (DUF2249 family)